MPRLLFLLLLAGVAALPLRASADAKSEARARMEKATALHASGKYADALIELSTAYSLDPRPDVLYAIAQTHVQLGNCALATTYYERFLSTRPAAVPAAAAREAIDSCKAGSIQPDRPVEAIGPPPEALPAPAPTPAPLPERPAGPAPWYKDWIGDALVGGGVACGAIALLTYRAAVGDLDDAERATDYEHHAELVDRARGKRTIAAALAIGGVALVGGGVARFVLHRRRGLDVTPVDGGAVVGWAGSF